MTAKRKLKAKKLAKVKPLTVGTGPIDGPVHGPINVPIPRLAANHNEVALRA